MSYCDEKLKQPLGDEDCTFHYPKFPHICDHQQHHLMSHLCACGHQWPKRSVVALALEA